MTIIVLLIVLVVIINIVIQSRSSDKEKIGLQELENNERIMANEVDGDTEKVMIEGPRISAELNYIGYYADIDGNGSVDGIIYADLAHDAKGTWNEDDLNNYEYTKQSNLKNYYISQKNYEGDFGKADVISPIKDGTSGQNDRFYVMALKDFTQGTDEQFFWYYEAVGKLNENDIVNIDYNDFGEGKTNTIAMINNWNSSTYGAQTTNKLGKIYIDIWGPIQDGQYEIVENETNSGKWFIPSKSEWTAFGDYLYTKLGGSTDNYSNYKLNNRYHTSSQENTMGAFCIDFISGYIGSGSYFKGYYVRLSTTF